MSNSKAISFNELPDVLNAKIISMYLGIGYVKALNLIKYSGIPYIKIGNTYRVSKNKFNEWLNESGQRIINL